MATIADELAVTPTLAQSLPRSVRIWEPARLRRWRLPILVGVTLAVLVAGAAVMAAQFRAFSDRGLVGIDLRMFQEHGQRWLQTGSMYASYQVAGPYPYDLGSGTADVAVMPALYPPIAAPLFAGLRFLPPLLWWAIPLGFLAWFLMRMRPAPWTWPLMASVTLLPATAGVIAAGGSTMWVAAGVAGGLLYGWPILAVALKPSFLPFLIVGARHRSLWIGLWGWAALTLAMLDQSIVYMQVMTNVQGASLLYSLPDYPLVAVPVIAWLGRRK